MLSQLRIHSLTLNFILYISLASSFVLQVSAAAVALPRQSIKLGAILMLTGDQAVYGKALLEGIELATEEINASGGINGTQISLMVEDSQLSPKTAHSAATKFVNVDHVTAALNASFIETMANGKVFESAHIPVVSLWDSATEIEQIGDYVFGIGLWTPSSAKRAADFAAGDLGAKTAVVINLQAEWSETVAGLFEKDFAARGGKILKRISVIPSTADFRTPIQLMKSLKPDVIYCPLTENLIPFYKQLREAKFESPVITSDIIAPEHIRQAPAVFEGVYQTNAPEPSLKTSIHLRELYLKKYGSEPGLPLFVAWGYDGINLLARAIATVGQDPVKIKEYLYTVRDFPGASAKITFNARGSSPVMEQMFQIRDGKFELMDTD